MKRTIRSCLVSVSACLVICSCAHSVAPPAEAVFNDAKEVHRVPVLADNIAAYVLVYCFWRNPADGETIWDTMPGVVLDQVHVLTVRCDDVSEMAGWEGSRMDPLTVGPFDDNNESGHGPWEARQVTKYSEYSDLVVVTTNSPLPLPSVAPAAKAPELGDILYTATPVEDDGKVGEIELLVISVFEEGKGQYWSSEIDFIAVMPNEIPCCYTAPVGVFNQQHEFVGFVVGSSSSVVPQNTPAKFKGKTTWTMGYDFAGTHRGLKTLLRQAGVAWPK